MSLPDDEPRLSRATPEFCGDKVQGDGKAVDTAANGKAADNLERPTFSLRRAKRKRSKSREVELRMGCQTRRPYSIVG